MGGSLARHGGQNPIEPAKLGAAILHGPHVWNFAEIYAALDAAHGAEAGDRRRQARGARRRLAQGRARARRGGCGRARRRVAALGGALERTLAALEPYLMQIAARAARAPCVSRRSGGARRRCRRAARAVGGGLWRDRGAAARAAGRRAGVPVVCIGNLTVGGAGKTPTAIAVARMLASGRRTAGLPHRGYGGALAGPVGSIRRGTARATSATSRCCSRAWRRPSWRAIASRAPRRLPAGASVIVMDDGLQNPSLAKDFSVLVVDGRRGIGNGRVFPPVRCARRSMRSSRAPMRSSWSGASTARCAVAADGARARHSGLAGAACGRIAAFIAALAGRRVLAFAGIGDPQKFFATLAEAGIAVAATRSFPDHHRYTRAEAAALCEQADRDGLALVTTEKDLARLCRRRRAAAFAARARALPVTLVFEDEARFRIAVAGAPRGVASAARRMTADEPTGPFPRGYAVWRWGNAAAAPPRD